MNTVLLGLALSLGAPTPKAKDAPPSLVGEWVIEQRTVGGRPSAAVERPEHWIFGADGQHTIVDADGDPVHNGQYTAHPKAGTIDLASHDIGPHLCRYLIEGDALTLAVGWPDKGRPAELESKPGSKCTLYVMKRVKCKE